MEVSAAIIKNAVGEVLICQRPKGKQHALRWEFPGGKQEADETLQQCLVRECQEELGVEIAIDHYFTDIIVAGERPVHLSFFCCHLVSGELQRLEHAAIAWVTVADLLAYDFCAADGQVARLLQSNQ